MSLWSDIAETVGEAAPLLGGVLAGPAGAAGGRLLASALGVEADAEACRTALEQDPDALVKAREVELAHRAELARLDSEAETARLRSINETMRAEAASNDAYVRRWRPTFGYITALVMAGLIGGLVWVMVATPEYTAEIVQAVAAVQPLLVMMLAVLGVNIDKRSKDKQVAAGQTPPPGIMGAFAEAISGRGPPKGGGR